MMKYLLKFKFEALLFEEYVEKIIMVTYSQTRI